MNALNSYTLDFLAPAQHRRLLDEAAREHVKVHPGDDNTSHFEFRSSIKKLGAGAVGAGVSTQRRRAVTARCAGVCRPSGELARDPRHPSLIIRAELDCLCRQTTKFCPNN